jgi:hypothetical protein
MTTTTNKDTGHTTIESVIPANKVELVKQFRLQAQEGMDWVGNQPTAAGVEGDEIIFFADSISDWVDYYFSKREYTRPKQDEWNVPSDKPAGFYLGALMAANQALINGDCVGIKVEHFESENHKAYGKHGHSAWNKFAEMTYFMRIVPSAISWLKAHKKFCATPRGAVVNMVELEKMGCKQELSIIFLYFAVTVHNKILNGGCERSSYKPSNKAGA